jgi:hypothetical protein
LFDLLRHETDIVGYPILPLVHQLVKQCGEADGYVHWGVRPKCHGNGILAGQCDSGQPRLERGPPSRLNHLLKKAFKVLLVAELFLVRSRTTALW